VTTAVQVGNAAAVIIEVAQEQGCDLIVMGTHGRTGVAHLFLGSVAEKVVRTAPCPVLTIRSDTAAREAVHEPATETGATPPAVV
jgi:nucleotide-binding universal stress UspA family protein